MMVIISSDKFRSNPLFSLADKAEEIKVKLAGRVKIHSLFLAIDFPENRNFYRFTLLGENIDGEILRWRRIFYDRRFKDDWGRAFKEGLEEYFDDGGFIEPKVYLVKFDMHQSFWASTLTSIRELIEFYLSGDSGDYLSIVDPEIGVNYIIAGGENFYILYVTAQQGWRFG